MTEQVSHAVEAIKIAYLSHTPVVWLVTGDKEVASEIVKEFVEEHFGGFRYVKDFGGMKRECVQDNFKSFEGHSPNCTEPSIFYKWYNDDKKVLDSLYAKIESFIAYYYHTEVDGVDIQANTEHVVGNLKKSIVIIASPTLPSESWLTQYIEVIYVKALQDSEIRETILNTLSSKGITLADNDNLRKLVADLRGFSARKISQAILRCVLSGYFDNDKTRLPEILREVRFMKRQMLEGFVGLQWIDLGYDKDNVTAKQEQSKVPESLAVISKWLDDRKVIFKDTEKARKNGYDIPKGVLITGIPGTGKSMMAKETAKKLELPLISLDMGNLQEGIVGASEKHMVDALRKVEAMAPCVLWIDEIEKAFSGSNSGSSDGGVMRRMFGKFLTWMQEKKAPCFVFATSNDISQLPPELFRSERFDDKYFSFMPMADECAAIFSSLIKGENDRYKKNNPDNKEVCLFAVDLTNPDVWKDILNSYAGKRDAVAMDGNKWQDGRIPQCKLFTGADISMVVKLTKFKLLDEYKGRASNFSKDVVEKVVCEILEDFMPYGQTNLKDIARCFILLSRNRFKCASSSSVINFDEYDVDNSEMKYDASRYARSTDAYDKSLYAAVVGSINFYGKDIIRELDRK